LVPASDRVSGAVVGVQLAIAMTHASGLPVTILDFNTVQPAWDNAELLELDETRSKEIFPKVNVMRITRVTLRNDWNWVKARLDELETSRQYVLCDMTGMAQLGVLDESLALVDGAMSLVRPGHVWEWQLSRLHRRFGVKDLGVLFVEEGSSPRKRRR
jgi:hypothetical protein